MELLEHVVVEGAPFVLLQVLWLVVHGLEQRIPELRDHVELLKHGYHVTDVAKIIDAQEVITFVLPLLWLVVKFLRSLQIFDKIPKVVLHELYLFLWLILLDEDVEELVAGGSRLGTLALVQIWILCLSGNIE